MIRSRACGNDEPFLAWVRSQEDKLPSKSERFGLSLTDCDAYFHRYLTDVGDALGTRDIQGLMLVEAKGHGAYPRPSQVDTLFKVHILRKEEHPTDKWLIRHFGVSFLRMDGNTPDDSQWLEWGRFDGDGVIHWKRITLELLFDLLSFERHPDNFSKNPFRRHHQSRNIHQKETMPLGFHLWRTVIKRS